MVVRGALGAIAVVLLFVGAVFVGQGTNVIHGSAMSGHGGYAALGAVLLLLGLALLLLVWRLRPSRGR